MRTADLEESLTPWFENPDYVRSHVIPRFEEAARGAIEDGAEVIVTSCAGFAVLTKAGYHQVTGTAVPVIEGVLAGASSAPCASCTAFPRASSAPSRGCRPKRSTISSLRCAHGAPPATMSRQATHPRVRIFVHNHNHLMETSNVKRARFRKSPLSLGIVAAGAVLLAEASLAQTDVTNLGIE